MDAVWHNVPIYYISVYLSEKFPSLFPLPLTPHHARHEEQRGKIRNTFIQTGSSILQT